MSLELDARILVDFNEYASVLDAVPAKKRGIDIPLIGF
jgi:hypothetical protein